MFGLQIAAAKLRTFLIQDPSAPTSQKPEHIIIHGANWTPTIVLIRTSGPLKILGATLDFDNSSKSQKAISAKRIKLVCSVAINSRASPQAKAQALQIITIAREVYSLSSAHSPLQNSEL